MNFVVRNCTERMMKILKTLCEEYKIVISNSAFPQFYIESLNAFKKPSLHAKDELELTKNSSKNSIEGPAGFEMPESVPLSRHMTVAPKAHNTISDEDKNTREDIMAKLE